MPYVQRNDGGNIVGVFANKQDGIVPELVDDNDAAVVAFLAPFLAQSAAPVADAQLLADQPARGVGVMSDSDRIAALEARVSAVEARLSAVNVVK